MRKILFTLLAVGALLAVIPATSLAVGGDHHRGDRHHEPEHRGEHHGGRHHDGARHERFHGTRHAGLAGNAGRVASFTDGTLTIRLNDGTMVSGAVNHFTEVECEMPGDLHELFWSRPDNREAMKLL